MATPSRAVRVSKEWLRLLEALPATTGRIVLLGPTDSGKTTLCAWLVSKLRERAATAWVDLDPGQSQIGPPGTLGWRFAGSAEHRWTFLGDVTPASNPLVAATGAARLAHEAEAQGARLVVVDTTGYVQGPGAVALKSAKLDLLAPLHLVALGDCPAVRRVLAAWHTDERLTVHRLPLPDTLRQKTPGERRQWRQNLFAEYFAGCELQELSLAGRSLSGLPTASELEEAGRTWASLDGLLLGFHDRRRMGVALGLMERLNLKEHQLLVRTTAAAREARGIIFGSLRLNVDGTPRD